MSPDHEDLDPMTEQEIAALAALDRQGRAAGAALMTAVEAPPDDIHLVRLREGRARHRRPGRPWLLVAAVLIVVAAIAGSLLALNGDESPPVSSGVRPSYLLPRWLPDGYEPYSVMTTADAREHLGVPPDGRVVVYGLPNESDLWAAATITVARLGSPWERSGSGEPVTIAGRPGEVLAAGDAESVSWGADDATYVVVGQGLRREQVLAAAETAGAEPSLDPLTLPPGFEVIARAPASSTLGFLDQVSALAPDTLAATYLPAGSHDQERAVALVERPGGAADVDLARLWTESRPGEVRGQHAVIGAFQTPGNLVEHFVQWWEPPDLLVTVVGRGVSEDELLRVVDELGPAEAGEIERLLAEHGLRNGMQVETPVAAGDRAGTAWTLSANSADDGTVSLTLDIGDTSESLSWVPGGDGGLEDYRLSFPISYGQPERAVFAASEGQVARITIEAADLPAQDLAVYPGSLDGQSFTAFLGFVPVEDETTFTVIAYDANGRELQRGVLPSDDSAGL